MSDESATNTHPRHETVSSGVPNSDVAADKQAGWLIKVNGLSYAYPSGQRALDEVSFEVGASERVGLVGPSGAGKSTLLLHLNGLLPDRAVRDAANAQVFVSGSPVIEANFTDVRRRVGFLFQDPDDQLFCSTVRDDVAFGPLNLGLDEAEVVARVRASLAAVGLPDHLNRGTMQLSVGEKRRVCLAGVLACEPEVLVLDEPSSNLDPSARNTLIDILRGFDGSQLIASHDLDLIAELCSRTIVLDDAKIRANGPTAQVLSDARLMESHRLEVPWRYRATGVR